MDSLGIPAQCIPTPLCVQQARSFIYRNRHGFWVGNGHALKEVSAQLPSIFDGNQTLQLVDLGAGMYGGKYENGTIRAKDDDSDALILLAGFGKRAHVHALEARPDKAEELREEAQRRPQTTAYEASNLHVYAMGASDSPGSLRFAHCGGGTNWMILPNGTSPHAGCHVKYTVPVRSLDEMAASGTFFNQPISYVKVDVEGGEIEVAKGMQNLLASQQIDLMSFEYAKNWNPELFYLAQTGQNKRITPAHMAALDNSSSMRERTLGSFQKRMTDLGYDTYLLHGDVAKEKQGEGPRAPKPSATVVTLVPVYGDFFSRADVEICLRRHHFLQPFCWNDLLVVRRGNVELKERLLHQFHGSRRSLFPNCTCI